MNNCAFIVFQSNSHEHNLDQWCGFTMIQYGREGRHMVVDYWLINCQKKREKEEEYFIDNTLMRDLMPFEINDHGYVTEMRPILDMRSYLILMTASTVIRLWYTLWALDKADNSGSAHGQGGLFNLAPLQRICPSVSLFNEKKMTARSNQLGVFTVSCLSVF